MIYNRVCAKIDIDAIMHNINVIKNNMNPQGVNAKKTVNFFIFGIDKTLAGVYNI